MEFVLCRRSPQRLAHFPFTAFGGLPAFEADFSHDVINVIYDACDDDEGGGGAGLLEEVGEAALARSSSSAAGTSFFGVD